jgi:hypothetical protein
MAPDGDAALRAARDALALAAGRGRQHELRLVRAGLQPVALDHRVQREGRAGFALAPAAMAGVHHERCPVQAVAHAAAVAAAFEDRRVGHRRAGAR